MDYIYFLCYDFQEDMDGEFISKSLTHGFFKDKNGDVYTDMTQAVTQINECGKTVFADTCEFDNDDVRIFTIVEGINTSKLMIVKVDALSIITADISYTIENFLISIQAGYKYYEIIMDEIAEGPNGY